MVANVLSQWRRYSALHPAFSRAFEYLAGADWSTIAPRGAQPSSIRREIDGDRLFVSIDRTEGRGRGAARLEAHRRYIDIQLTIDGQEEIGWQPLGRCTQPDGHYDEARDVGFFSDRPESWVSLPAGHFAIFFPDDAHAPLAGRGMLTKAIMKIAVD
jgi:YhcH/YjgK/YiaL family protein